MTLSTDQTIQSNIFISKFLANDIQTNGINGILEYEKQVALAGQENVIESKKFTCLKFIIHLLSSNFLIKPMYKLPNAL